MTRTTETVLERLLREDSTETRTRRERALMAVAMLDAEAVETLSELSRAADMVSTAGCRFAGMQPA